MASSLALRRAAALTTTTTTASSLLRKFLNPTTLSTLPHHHRFIFPPPPPPLLPLSTTRFFTTTTSSDNKDSDSVADSDSPVIVQGSPQKFKMENPFQSGGLPGVGEKGIKVWAEGNTLFAGKRKIEYENEDSGQKCSCSLRLIMREDNEGLYFLIDMPGVDKDKLKIYDEEDILIITGAAEKESEDDEPRRYSSRLDLSTNLYNIYSVKAELKNGVLKIRIPKVKW